MKFIKKFSKLSIAALAATSITVSGTFAWFVARTVSASAETDTAAIYICGLTMEGSSNWLPGQTVDLKLANDNLSMRKIFNSGSTRDFVAELNFDNMIKATLPAGVTVPADLIANGDYTLDTATGRYMLTEKRIKEVVKPYMDMKGLSSDYVLEYDGKYYVNVPVYTDTAIGAMYLTILPDLGGLVQTPSGQTISRQFEQEAVFDVKFQLTAVQKTREAFVDVFGEDPVKTFTAAFFDDTSK